ncbi:MAG: hypothetical protein M0P38_07480 [Bacteroidales bacterium]|nr:hypothetical protein [Bacteroidales bacterium]
MKIRQAVNVKSLQRRTKARNVYEKRISREQVYNHPRNPFFILLLPSLLGSSQSGQTFHRDLIF